MPLNLISTRHFHSAEGEEMCFWSAGAPLGPHVQEEGLLSAPSWRRPEVSWPRVHMTPADFVAVPCALGSWLCPHTAESCSPLQSLLGPRPCPSGQVCSAVLTSKILCPAEVCLSPAPSAPIHPGPFLAWVLSRLPSVWPGREGWSPGIFCAQLPGSAGGGAGIHFSQEPRD